MAGCAARWLGLGPLDVRPIDVCFGGRVWGWRGTAGDVLGFKIDVSKEVVAGCAARDLGQLGPLEVITIDGEGWIGGLG